MTDSFWDKFWRNKNGQVVVWQTPNLVSWGWVACTVTLLFLKSGALYQGFTFLGSAFLFTWAYLELFTGVNYFRRSVGAIVLVFLILSNFK